MAKKKSTTRKNTTVKKTQASGENGASKIASQASSAGASGKKKTSRKTTARTTTSSSGTGAAGTTRAGGAKKATTGQQGNGDGAARKPSRPPTPAPAVGAHASPTPHGQGHFNGQQLPDEELRKVKTGLTKRELDSFRQLLLEKRNELIGDVESLQKDARNEDASISYEHMADVGTDSYEQEFTLGLVESERKLLGEIDEALERLSKGIYGVCVVSGEPIGKPRLEAKPWAKHSIEVTREREKRGLA